MLVCPHCFQEKIRIKDDDKFGIVIISDANNYKCQLCTKTSRRVYQIDLDVFEVTPTSKSSDSAAQKPIPDKNSKE